MQRLFVYGSLAPGASNEHVLADVDGQWEPASVTGALVDEGSAFEQGYPAIVLSMDGPVVDGLLFSSDDLAEHWARLDEFEGEDYERVTVRARRQDGQPVAAHVYVHKAN
ncbi:gamma-glutamylcyclotransferase family protein [Nocardioides sp.]|uniref:gamma-glutamylcyclotransferase family protein n=1 Tax=Nocardioides sp. TaxID=35761 RepID=UPI002CE1A2AE|nr:gamma-glutamylcyclotransferase family protein [Nocardioides sp.]HXH77022.1 gamma-glutamylcyclotransferase family protein [Nocardioides sp.]